MCGYGKYSGPEITLKIGDWVINPEGRRVQVTRVDRHVYPVCAGYYRYKPEQLKLVKT